MNSDQNKTETPADDDRIQRMLAVEQELATQLEEQRDHDRQSDLDGDDPVADSRISASTGRIVDFEKTMVEPSMPSATETPRLSLTILTPAGKQTEWLDWPDDPTDDAEPVVRLCQHLDVPLDRLADLHGQYVPIDDDGAVDIPPIQTRGNQLLYSARRFSRRHPRVSQAVKGTVLATASLLWIPLSVLFVRLDNDTAPFISSALGDGGVVLLMVVITVLVAISALALGVTLGKFGPAAYSKLKTRFFPSSP